MLENNGHHNQELLDFCKEKETMPPPQYSPDGESGEWQWEEDREIILKHFSKGRLPIPKGMWLWKKDALPTSIKVTKKKGWIRRFLGFLER